MVAPHPFARSPGLALAMLGPDRPHNFGGALRVCACFGVDLHVIEPCGFPLDDRRVKEAALDYHAAARWFRHADLGSFFDWAASEGRRILLLSTGGEHRHHAVAYRADDLLVTGTESAGAPPELHAAAALRVRIPLAPHRRSLNVVSAATIVLGEALRQLGAFDAPVDVE